MKSTLDLKQRSGVKKAKQQIKPTCTVLTLDNRICFLTLNNFYNVSLAFEVLTLLQFTKSIDPGVL